MQVPAPTGVGGLEPSTQSSSTTPPIAVASGGPPAPPDGSTQQQGRRPSSLADFELGPTLGTGSFGRVRLVTTKRDGAVYALKMLKKEKILQLQQVQHILDEKAILQWLSHPFIVRLVSSFQDPRYMYLVLSYIVGGEFFSHLRRVGRFSPELAKFYAAQVTLVFEYLHRQDIIYRDLKPENLLLDAQGYLKITDFGFAKVVPHKTFTLCGTPEYIAPEILLNKGHGKGVDWWTLGILIYEILVGHPPFNDHDPMAIYQQILQSKPAYPEGVIGKDTKSLIKHLLAHDLTKRYGCLVNGADDVKNHRWFAGVAWDDLLGRRLAAPFVPETHGPKDTSNFDKYRESKTDEGPAPVFDADTPDPFVHF